MKDCSSNISYSGFMNEIQKLLLPVLIFEMYCICDQHFMRILDQLKLCIKAIYLMRCNSKLVSRQFLLCRYTLSYQEWHQTQYALSYQIHPTPSKEWSVCMESYNQRYVWKPSLYNDATVHIFRVPISFLDVISNKAKEDFVIQLTWKCSTLKPPMINVLLTPIRRLVCIIDFERTFARYNELVQIIKVMRC